MALTSPDNIWTPDSGDDYALTTDLATMADTIQDALVDPGNIGRGTTANRPAAGQKGRWYYATDTDIRWFDNGSAWKNRTIARAQVTSTTGVINGTATLSWSNSLSAYYYQMGGTFWGSGQPTRILAPYTGQYRFAYAFRIANVFPVTVTPIRAVTSPGNLTYGISAAVGASGAASTGARTFDVSLVAGDYITFDAVSTGSSSGTHNLTVEFLGEV